MASIDRKHRPSGARPADKRDIAQALFQDHLDIDRMARAVKASRKTDDTAIGPPEPVRDAGPGPTGGPARDTQRKAAAPTPVSHRPPEQGGQIPSEKAAAPVIKRVRRPIGDPVPPSTPVAAQTVQRSGRYRGLAVALAVAILVVAVLATGPDRAADGPTAVGARPDAPVIAGTRLPVESFGAPSSPGNSPDLSLAVTSKGDIDRIRQSSVPPLPAVTQDAPPEIARPAPQRSTPLWMARVLPAPAVTQTAPGDLFPSDDRTLNWRAATPLTQLAAYAPSPPVKAFAMSKSFGVPAVAASVTTPIAPMLQAVSVLPSVPGSERDADNEFLPARLGLPGRANVPVPLSADLPSTVAPVASARPTPRPARAQVEAIPPAPSNDTAFGPARLVIHYPGARGRARAEALAQRLQGQRVELRQVDIAVSRNDVRYFYAADSEAARGAVAVISGQDRPTVIRDLSGYRPLPRRGTVEIWLAP